MENWILVSDRLPDNAKEPGKFCPRYLVQTEYGVTEGWYNPNHGCWYALLWYMILPYTPENIDIERGDIPRLSKNVNVTAWMPFPEPVKEG